VQRLTSCAVQLDRQISHVPERSESIPTTMRSLDNLELSKFIELCNDLTIGRYSIRFTLVEKRPLVFKIGRATLILLVVGFQIGLSLVAI
jgi:hypothetical protein